MIRPGSLEWIEAGGPYRSRILRARLWVTNASSAPLSFVRIKLQALDNAKLLSEPAHYEPELPIDEARPFELRIGGLGEALTVEATIRYRADDDMKEDVHRVTLPADGPAAALGVFLSYCTRDLSRIWTLVAVLESLGCRVWWAEQKLGKESWFPREITEAMSRADCVVVGVSESSVASKWVLGEIQLALDALARERLKAIVPVVLDDIDVPTLLEGVEPVPFDGEEPSAWRALSDRMRGLIG